MAENFEAIIGANIKAFQRAMREVDREIRETAMGAEAEITADISEFMSEIAAVDSMLTELADEHNIDISSDVAEVISEIESVDEALSTLPENVDINIDSEIAEVLEEIEAVDQAISSLPSEVQIDIDSNVADVIAEAEAVDAALSSLPGEVDIDVEADVAGAIADIAAVDAAAAALPNEVEIDVDVNTHPFLSAMALINTQTQNVFRGFERRLNNVQSAMDRFAQSIRTFGEIARYSLSGLLLMISPAIVPVIAHLIGVLGNLGVMLGVIAGSTFALVSAFAAAAIGILGFVAVAIPSIKAVHGEVEDMTKAQRKAYESLKVVKSTWKDIQDSVSDKAASAYGSALKAVAAILKGLKPMFVGVADAFNRLMESLNKSVGSPPVKAFFDYLNKEAGPLTETVLISLGNLLQGFFNMMTAFGPLTKSTAQGFLEMSERFADWSAGLSKSKAFQNFVTYVETNMPKIRAIFRDAIAGIIYMFAAFGPSASEWMDRLKEMMAGFKEWSKALGDNAEFKGFIDYLKENGPKVADLIGNIVTFLKELGIALAPMGTQMLDSVNNFLVWSAAMMDAHPWVGKIIAAVIVLAGAFIALLPLIIAVGAFIGPGLIGKMVMSAAKMIWTAGVFVAKWIWMATVATANAIRIAAAWLWATGSSMVVALARMIATAAVFVARWLWMGIQSLLHAAKIAAAWALATGVAMVRALASMIATAAVFVAKWLWMGVQSLLHAAKVAAAWALSTGAAMARAVASMIATAAVFVAKWAWMGVKALFHAARMAAAWFIALGPVGWVIGVVVALVILIIANWDKVSAWTKKAWTAVWTWIKDTWQKIKSKTTEVASNIWNTVKQKFSDIVSAVKEKMNAVWNGIVEIWGEVMSFFQGIDLYEIGVNIIQGLVNGVTSMADSLIRGVKGVVNGAIEGAKALLGIASPSKLFKSFGEFTGEGFIIGVNKMNTKVANAASNMASAASNAFSPQMANMQASASLNTAISSSDMKAMKHSFSADIEDMETPDPTINVYNEWDGEKVVSYVERGNAKRSRITDGFYGK
ncbi:phage tail protein [Metabacillus idriensis]|uniref:phage tail protein n=1 Tax=Metabacillus idriensis TaxID=324768 RepID=UPI00174A2687|nr:hypothetical protein [Metabacillus idriensis]